MGVIEAIVLAVVQGLSEFLPISSSGHLVLVPHLLGWPDQGLAFDVAVHGGPLIALLVYFRRELITMAGAWLRSFTGTHDRDSRLARHILAGPVPGGLGGLSLR